MQFNIVPRTGGLAQIRGNWWKKRVRWHNSHKEPLEICRHQTMVILTYITHNTRPCPYMLVLWDCSIIGG